MRSNTLENPLVRRAVRAVLTGGTLATSFVAAHAQDASQTGAPAANQAATAQTTAQATASPAAPTTSVPEVVVTGSRIAVPNATSISPVTFVSAQDFQQTGVTKVEDLLNQLPQVFADQAGTASNGADGTADIDLRGLGAKRTLVLVDGDRLGPGSPVTGAQSDINMIPAELISSVEILTGGASSTYGADAVAGVVNFKLIQNFQGVRLVGDVGGYENDNYDIDQVREATTASGFAQAPSTIWNGAQRSLAFISGFNTGDGSGNVTFYATYRNVLPIVQKNYSWSQCTLGSGYLGTGTNATGGKFTCAGSLTADPAHLYNLTTGAIDTIGPDYTAVPFAPSSLYNFGALNYYQRPDERYTAGTFMHYEFNEHATVYEQLMMQDDRSLAQIAESGDFADTSSFNCSNPFLEANAAAYAFFGCTPGGTTNPNVIILRRSIESGPRIQDTEFQDLHEVLGIKGNIDSAWTYDASFQYTLSDLNESQNNYLSDAKMNNALNVTGTVGDASCVVGPPCVPWNIFTVGGVTPAQVAYLSTPGLLQGRISQTDLLLSFTGDLGKYGVQLPTASSGMQLNVGAEYRDVKSDFLPDEESQEGDLGGSGGPTPPVSGGIIAREGFAEVLMPLVEDKFLASSVNFNAGYRYSSYDLGFNTNTYKLGLDWAPTKDVRLRGTFTRAVRAPNVVELFAPAAIGLDGTYSTDPCGGAAPAYTLAQCEKTGVTPAEYGHIGENPAGQYNGLLGGNTNLVPETALTGTIGIEFTPQVLPGFHANVDYYNIKIESVIGEIGGAVILNECANSGEFCDLIHRGPGGTLWAENTGFITDTLENVGLLQEKGIDIDVGYHYRFDRWGGIITELQGTYMEHYYFEPIQGNVLTEYDCAGLYGAACGSNTSQPSPRWRHRWSTTWDTPWEAFSLTLAWRYIGPVRFEELSSNPNLAAPTGETIANGGISNTDAYLSSYSYFDLSAAVKLADKVTFRLGCNNILDKAPPLIGTTDLEPLPAGNGNTYPSFYEALGRFVFAEIVADF